MKGHEADLGAARSAILGKKSRSNSWESVAGVRYRLAVRGMFFFFFLRRWEMANAVAGRVVNSRTMADHRGSHVTAENRRNANLNAL